MSSSPLRRARLASGRLLLLAANAALLAAPAVALAQAPPEPRLTRTHPVWVGYAFMFLLIAVIVAISLMPSKRAHQD